MLKNYFILLTYLCFLFSSSLEAKIENDFIYEGSNLKFRPDPSSLLGKKVQVATHIFNGGNFSSDPFSYIDLFSEQERSGSLVICNKIVVNLPNVSPSFLNEEFFSDPKFSERIISSTSVTALKDPGELYIDKTSEIAFIGKTIHVSGNASLYFYPNAKIVHPLTNKQKNDIMKLDSHLPEPQGLLVSYLSGVNRFIYDVYNVIKVYEGPNHKGSFLIIYQSVALRAGDWSLIPNWMIKKFASHEVVLGIDYTISAFRDYTSKK